IHGRGLALAGGLALGVGVAAASLLPAAELIGLSTRGFGVEREMQGPSLTLDRLRALFVPFASGGSIGPLYGRSANPMGWLLSETTGYPGMLVLLAVLAGLPRLLGDRRGGLLGATA